MLRGGPGLGSRHPLGPPAIPGGGWGGLSSLSAWARVITRKVLISALVSVLPPGPSLLQTSELPAHHPEPPSAHVFCSKNEKAHSWGLPVWPPRRPAFSASSMPPPTTLLLFASLLKQLSLSQLWTVTPAVPTGDRNVETFRDKLTRLVLCGPCGQSQDWGESGRVIEWTWLSQRKNYLSVKNVSEGCVLPGPQSDEIFAPGGVNGAGSAEEGSRWWEGLAYTSGWGGVGWPHIWNLWICCFSRLDPGTWVSELEGQGPRRTS